MEHFYILERWKNNRWQYLGYTDSLIMFTDLMVLYGKEYPDTVFRQSESVDGKANGVVTFWKKGKKYNSTEGLL